MSGAGSPGWRDFAMGSSWVRGSERIAGAARRARARTARSCGIGLAQHWNPAVGEGIFGHGDEGSRPSALERVRARPAPARETRGAVARVLLPEREPALGCVG